MSKHTLVSVVMAEYNTDPYLLKEAIESILNQTFYDFEFIIVDDNGRNDVKAIVNEYNDARIKVVKNKCNMGLPYSLNRAINLATGVYIVRMDTDDISLPNRIKILTNFIEKHPEYSVVGSRAIEFSDNIDQGILGNYGEKNISNITFGDTLVHPSVIMRKSDILSIGGYPFRNRSEDLALWCELLLAKKRLYVLEDILLRYRVNPTDYNKRKLRFRVGEIKTRLYYYPRLNASFFSYAIIIKSIIAGLLPIWLIRLYRKTFVLTTANKVNKDSHGTLEEKNTKLVSVIVPVFNSESFLPQCIDSILLQTHTAIELILINDGSTDRSGNICDSYKDIDNRIQVIHQKNKGVSHARNVGLSQKSGDYIMFVDSDDFLAPNCISRLVDVVVNTKVDIVACQYTRSIRDLDLSNIPTINQDVLSNKQALIRLLYPSNLNNGPVAKLISSKIVRSIYFDENLTIAEDLYFNYNLLKKVNKLGIIEDKLYYYRKTEGSAMQVPFQKSRMDGTRATQSILNNALKYESTNIIKAAQSRHFMEAIFIGIKIINSDVYCNEYNICKNIIQDLNKIVVWDSCAPISYRMTAMISIINLRFALNVYKNRGFFAVHLRNIIEKIR